MNPGHGTIGERVRDARKRGRTSEVGPCPAEALRRTGPPPEVARQPYDETRWIQSLKDRGSWLSAETLKLMEQPLEPMEAPL